jgi:hypothetical protein
MSASPKIYVFQCSDATYLECVEKSVFGDSKPWPLQVAQGDLCLLHHYDIGEVFALWRASTNGGRNLVPKAWGGRFRFQAKVVLISSSIIQVPKTAVDQFITDPSTGRLDTVLEGARVENLLTVLRGAATPLEV